MIKCGNEFMLGVLIGIIISKMYLLINSLEIRKKYKSKIEALDSDDNSKDFL